MSELVEGLTSPLRIAVSHLAVGSCVTERPHYAGAATRLINAREILTMTINWTRTSVKGLITRIDDSPSEEIRIFGELDDLLEALAICLAALKARKEMNDA